MQFCTKQVSQDARDGGSKTAFKSAGKTTHGSLPQCLVEKVAEERCAIHHPPPPIKRYMWLIYYIYIYLFIYINIISAQTPTWHGKCDLFLLG